MDERGGFGKVTRAYAWLAFAVCVGIAVCIALFAGLSGCSAKRELPGPDAGVVSAFTGGLVSRGEAVRVVFTESKDTGSPIPAGAFTLEPAAEGELSWENEWTLVFSPSVPFAASMPYRAVVNPALLGGTGRVFAFEFTTLPPFLAVRFDAVRFDGEGSAFISGCVEAERGVSLEDAVRVVRPVSGELGKPEWRAENGLFFFSFAPVRQEKSEKRLEIGWDGGPVGSRERGSSTFVIPGREEGFEVLDIRQLERNTFEITFSSPLKRNQDLRGFITLTGGAGGSQAGGMGGMSSPAADGEIRFSLEQNVARVFSGSGIAPGDVLSVRELEDARGRRLVRPVQYTASSRWELPAVRFAGSGNILPTSQGSSMVVQTRNISGLIVEAFQIPGRNLVQFLQVNSISGTRELNRVGEPVWSRAFDFPWEEGHKNRWLRRGLDLSELARRFPGDMFHIRVTFRKRHVHYVCPNSHPDFSHLEFPGDELPPLGGGGEDGEVSFWDSYLPDKWDGDWYNYVNDPDHPAFYTVYGHNNKEVTAGRNVLVSDLGLIAKRAASGEWLVAASDLRTARPPQSVEFEFVNYQGRVLETVRAGGNGMAMFKPQASPFFIFARSEGSLAFLKVNDANALISSHFDVAGDKPVAGIKGTIFGERGVWRPGDPVYLTFLLWDTQGSLPENHPVLFELEDPLGRVVENRTYTSGTDGFYPIHVSTRSDAPTGDWTARVRVGGSVFSKNLKIETVMPNRLKLNLSAGGRPYLDTSRIPMTLESAWLHGAPSPNLRADVSVVFADRDTRFPQYGDYTFRDPSRSVSGERVMLFDDELDDASRAVFSVNLNAGSAVPGKLSARFLTRVFEPSGVFSSEQVTLDFSPYSRYVGLKLPRGDAARNMLLTDTDHRAEMVVLDADGKPVRDSVELDCGLYKLNWRWWWEKGADEAAEFTNALSREPIMRERVKTSGGKVSWNFRVNYPAWGRYLVIARDAEGGHAAAKIVYIDWPGWAGRQMAGAQGASAMLTLSADKPAYSPGEAVVVNFPSNKESFALVVVEKGGEIIRQEWMACGEGTTQYRFKTEPFMTPNVYVHVTLLQKHLQTANDLPIRLYGIIPVAIDDPATRLTPQISAPAAWQPLSKASFTVKEASGRPMTYMAFVVDEGLLGLTRYSMPDPREVFYRKEASFMKYWDMYSDVMSAYSGKLETLLAIGGGDDELDAAAKETQRFKPVVFAFGPFRLGAGESRTQTFDMPQYVGAVRVMVAAASPPEGRGKGTGRNVASVPQRGRAYGAVEQEVKVKSDLMVLGTLPRTLSPEDEITVPVTVFSYAEGKRTVSVRLSVGGNASLVQGEAASLEAAFDKPGDKIVRFKVRAGKIPGPAKFVITASSQGLRDAIEETSLDVRSTAIPVSKGYTELLAPLGSWEGSLALPGRAGTNEVTLELSRMPPLGLESRLSFLIQYPHGCVEQTTSGVFPQLYIDKVMKLGEGELGRIRENVVKGIERLGGFQNYTGGFSYWPGSPDVSSWGTNYAGHFLVSARRAGYAVPEALVQNWVGYQKKQASAWAGKSESELLDQAYRLYTLALAGAADIGSMNRLRERKDNPPAVSWRLAAAYWYAGQRDTARSLAAELSLETREYRELSGTFGSGFRDKAMILEALALLGENGKAKDVLESVAATLASEKWLSTQETAYALIAVLPYVDGGGDGEPIAVDYTVDGAQGNVSFTTPFGRTALAVKGESARVSLNNRSGMNVYARFSCKGLPEEGREPSLAEGLSIKVAYRNAGGEPISGPDDVSLGEDMLLDVSVHNSRPLEVKEIALVHALPASWEIVNTRIGEASPARSDYKYQDIRDDRVMTYFDLKTSQSKTVRLRVTKTYAGSFFRPAIHAYAMYDETIRALVPGERSAEK